MVSTALILLGLAVGAPQPAPALFVPAGVRLVIESLDLALTTPDRWRISPLSNPAELVLVSGSERAQTNLRVRRSIAVRTPREHMREIAVELGPAYAGIEFETEVKRTEGTRELTLVSASDGGSLHARLFVVRLAPESEHLFWLDGSARDVERAFAEVLACIDGATAAGGPVAISNSSTDAPAIRHRPSGLVIERHPTGLEPRSIEADALDADGLAWALEGPSAPLAEITLTRRSVAPLVDETTAAGSLGSELRNDPSAWNLSSSRERLANQPARRVTWQRAGPGRGRAFETWFFKSGSSLFRLDIVAQVEWLETNQAALEDFRRGLRFAEQE